jgi:hypothetical protein
MKNPFAYHSEEHSDEESRILYEKQPIVSGLK